MEEDSSLQSESIRTIRFAESTDVSSPEATRDAAEEDAADAIMLAMQRCETKISRLQQRVSPVVSTAAH